MQYIAYIYIVKQTNKAMKTVNLKAIYQICENIDKSKAYWKQRAVMTIYHIAHKNCSWYTLNDAWRFVKGYGKPDVNLSGMMSKMSYKSVYGEFKSGRYVGD